MTLTIKLVGILTAVVPHCHFVQLFHYITLSIISSVTFTVMSYACRVGIRKEVRSTSNVSGNLFSYSGNEHTCYSAVQKLSRADVQST